MFSHTLRNRSASALLVGGTIMATAVQGAAAPADVSPLSTPDATAFAHASEHGSLAAAGRRAFQYLARIEKRPWADYLRTIRPRGVSAEAKARSLAVVRHEDIVDPCDERQAKLTALRPLLAYLERADVIDVKILRAGIVWAGFLEGAAILVSEEAVDAFSPEELQAVVAHELAHEYFSGDYETARLAKDYETVKEIELRCDAVSIITMKALGRNPEALMSAVSKLNRFNDRRGFPTSVTLYPSFKERSRFSRAVVELIKKSISSGPRSGSN